MPIKPKRQRLNLNLDLVTYNKLTEMAKKDNRTRTNLIEVLVDQFYDNWRGNALERQPRPDADRQTDSK